MKRAIVVLSFLVSQAAFSQNASQCTQQEAAQIGAQAERATLERVRADIKAEGRMQATALGIDDRDCLERARRLVLDLGNRAIEQCVSQTRVFRNCEVVDIRTVKAPSRIEAVVGTGHEDDYEVTEAQCKSNAQNNAVRYALEGCQRTYNRACRIASGPAEASHVIERRRRYGLFGPKEDYHVCHSSASALPDSREQISCTMEIVAKIKVL